MKRFKRGMVGLAFSILTAGLASEPVEAAPPNILVNLIAQQLPLVHGKNRVGPFFPQFPNGVAWIVEDRLAYQFVLGFVDKGRIVSYKQDTHRHWRPLAAATDSSYYAMEWKMPGATVRLRWATDPDGRTIGSVEADQATKVVLMALPTWKDFPAIVYRHGPEGLNSAATENQPGWSCRPLSDLVWYRVPETGYSESWFSRRYGASNFYPMMSGAPDPARAKRLLAIIQDPNRIWGDYVAPTISRDDPAFPDQDYWRGKVWGPVNYLFWVGLQRYAGPELLASFAQKSEALFLRNWVANGRCHENYLCNGEGSGDPLYTWGALLGLIGQEWLQTQ